MTGPIPSEANPLEFNRYLWTIDLRGINLAWERSPWPTERNFLTHTNLSSRASIGGEAWFHDDGSVTINASLGRFGPRAGATPEQYAAAIRYWERLGYKVNAVPFLEQFPR